MRLYLSMSEAVMPNILFRSFMSQSGLGGGGSPCGGTPGAVFGAAFGGGPAGGPELVVLGADIMAAEVGGGGVTHWWGQWVWRWHGWPHHHVHVRGHAHGWPHGRR